MPDDANDARRVDTSVRRRGGAHRRSEHPLKRPLPLHTLLFATIPVLVLYASNLKEDVPLGDVLKPLALIVVITVVVCALLTLAFRGNVRRAAIVVTALVLLFFSFGEVQSALVHVPVLDRQNVLLAAWLALALAVVVAVARARPARVVGVTKGLNFVAAGLVVINLASVAVYHVQSHGSTVTASDLVTTSSGGRAPAPGKRDVYYIMLEEYAGAKALHDIFHFDNSPFLDFLRSKGFYVVPHATTNYPHTAFSIGASLNLRYVQSLVHPAANDQADWTPVYKIIENDEVPKFLKSKGYEYIHVGSRWTPTATNPQADVNIRMPGSLSEFSQSLLKTTVLQPVGASLYNRLDFQEFEYKRVNFEFDQLAKLGRVKGPKFVFGHILVPHLPFIFDARGRFVNNADRAEHSDAYNYVQQLEYANRRTESLISTLLSGPVASRPIIVLQSDEGPYTGLEDGANATDEDIEQHFGILNAYYFPGITKTHLYSRITPVNSFRVLFSDYFGANLPVLPDRNYAFADKEHLYSFIDETTRVHRLS